MISYLFILEHWTISIVFVYDFDVIYLGALPKPFGSLRAPDLLGGEWR